MRSKLTGYDVGALLYCPANAHGSIVGAIVEQRFPTPYSLAFCLEDTVREDAVADAERMLRGTLSRIASAAEGGSFFLPPLKRWGHRQGLWPLKTERKSSPSPFWERGIFFVSPLDKPYLVCI